MKYAKKMMVVPYTTPTPVGSIAQQHNLNMTASLLNNLPNNEKNKIYSQALSKLRELADTLNKEDKFRTSITQLVENIENNLNKDYENTDLKDLEKEELKTEAAQRVVDYNLQDYKNKKSRKSQILSRELKHLDVNNVFNFSNRPHTRQAKRELEEKASATEELKNPSHDTLLPSKKSKIKLNDSFEEELVNLQQITTPKTPANTLPPIHELEKSRDKFNSGVNKLKVKFNTNYNKTAFISDQESDNDEKPTTSNLSNWSMNLDESIPIEEKPLDNTAIIKPEIDLNTVLLKSEKKKKKKKSKKKLNLNNETNNLILEKNKLEELQQQQQQPVTVKPSTSTAPYLRVASSALKKATQNISTRNNSARRKISMFTTS